MSFNPDYRENMNKSLFKRTNKTGPGGIRCNCCKSVPRGKNNSRKTNKTFLNKVSRRTFKDYDYE